jgi:hypothetical protein
VTPASQLDGVDGRLSAQRFGVEVMEFEEAPLVAAVAARADVAAPPAITHPDRALDPGRSLSGLRSA